MWIMFVVIAVICLLVYMRSEEEKRHFTVDTYNVESDKIQDNGKCVVFLSDLHNNCFGDKQKELLEAVAAIQPDAVLIGGDMMITQKETGEVAIDSALDLIMSLAKKYPVYYGKGNHESRLERGKNIYGNQYEHYYKILEAAGVIFVSGNKNETLGNGIMVGGLELEEVCYEKFAPKKLELSYIQEQLGNKNEEVFQILLAHSPAFFDAYVQWGADLTLSGHFHGGTIRIPGLGGVMTPQFQFFYPYCAGMFEKMGKHMIVSRGLGTHSVNLRLNNRAQLIAIKLIPKPC